MLFTEQGNANALTARGYKPFGEVTEEIIDPAALTDAWRDDKGFFPLSRFGTAKALPRQRASATTPAQGCNISTPTTTIPGRGCSCSRTGSR